MIRALVFAALLAFSTACKSDPAAECRLNSDCPMGVSCVSGRCLPACREDRDCPGSQICENALCVDPDPTTLCGSKSDCPRDQVCQAGVCGVPSLLGLDSGVPASRPDASIDPRDAALIEEAGVNDASMIADAGALLPYGAVCTRASECASMLCLGDPAAGSGRCTTACTVDQDCFYPDRCVDVPSAGRYCGPDTTGRATGEPCPNGPNECATGLCITVASGPICTHQCSPLPSCPSGLTCAPVLDGQGGAVAVCVPGNGGGFGESCTGSSMCASGLCVGIPASGSGACTSFCDQIPCPIGWTCTTVADGTGNNVRVCGPGSTSGGGFGATCTGASECASGLCLNDARIGSAFCTIVCNSSADCAQISGLACVLLATGEQVCAPP